MLKLNHYKNHGWYYLTKRIPFNKLLVWVAIMLVIVKYINR
jgi:hypothetical protein